MSRFPTLRNATHKLLRAKFMLPMSDVLGRSTRIEDGYVLTENATIKEVGQFTDEIGRRILSECTDLEVIGSYDNKEIPCHNAVLMPAFVKAHGHDHESPIIGVAKDVPLTTWLDDAVNIFTGFLSEHEAELTLELGMSPYTLTYLKAKLDDLSFGITSSMTHHCNFNKYHVPELAEAVMEAGVTCLIAVGAQDRNYDPRILDVPATVATDRMDRWLAECGDLSEHVSVLPGPDQFFSNGPELLMGLKEWANRHDTLFHIHSSEEKGTTDWFISEYGMTPIQYAHSIGVLDENTVVAHQVQTTPEDIKILAETGTKVVHNPLANTILGSGMPPILDMLEAGIPVAVSTDGSGSADSQNILSAARCASQYQKAFHQDATVLPAMDVLQMITIDAAQMLGINKGSLAAGMDADVVLVDLESLNMTPTHIETVAENLVWASAGDEISHVMANGEMLIEDYRFTRIDVEEVKRAIRRLSRMFLDYKATGASVRGTGLHQ